MISSTDPAITVFTFRWLLKNSAVNEFETIADSQLVILHTVITKAFLGKFKSHYPEIKVGRYANK